MAFRGRPREKPAIRPWFRCACGIPLWGPRPVDEGVQALLVCAGEGGIACRQFLAVDEYGPASFQRGVLNPEGHEVVHVVSLSGLRDPRYQIPGGENHNAPYMGGAKPSHRSLARNASLISRSVSGTENATAVQR